MVVVTLGRGCRASVAPGFVGGGLGSLALAEGGAEMPARREPSLVGPRRRVHLAGILDLPAV